MKLVTQGFLLLAVVFLLVQSEKNEDEGRPYEFGFTIDGQQHRHEKKDDKGIIQGEFGFITADGIYHVTVYATDENGNFKILSMKNLRISAPLDGSPLTGPISPEAGKYLKNVPQAQPQSQKPIAQPEPLSIPEQPAGPPQVPQQHQPVQAVQPVTTEKSKINYPFTTQPTIKPACAGCGYVTTQKPVPGQPFPFQNPIFKQQDAQGIQNQQGGGLSQAQGYQNNQQTGQFASGQQGGGLSQGYQSNQQTGQLAGGQQGGEAQIGGNQGQNGGQRAGPGAGFNAQGPGNNLLPPGANQQTGQVSSYQNTNTNTFETSKQQTIQAQGFDQQGPGQQSAGQQGQQYPVGQPNPNPLGFAPEEGQQGYQQNQGAGYQQQEGIQGGAGQAKQNNNQYSSFPPVAVKDNVINIGGNSPQQIPIKDKFPGMQDGLPEGIEEKDIKDLLYKFHYTVGFHGHYEKGYKNGAKIGGYFVNGRDGISRVVTYVADENGYRAKTKLINLGLDSDETPKEATEKKFGLKSFEFVWYPIE